MAAGSAASKTSCPHLSTLSTRVHLLILIFILSLTLKEFRIRGR